MRDVEFFECCQATERLGECSEVIVVQFQDGEEGERGKRGRERGDPVPTAAEKMMTK